MKGPKQPHTHYTKGRWVWIRLRDGTEVIGKFKERKGRFVRLDNFETTTDQIENMGFRKFKLGYQKQ